MREFRGAVEVVNCRYILPLNALGHASIEISPCCDLRLECRKFAGGDCIRLRVLLIGFSLSRRGRQQAPHRCFRRTGRGCFLENGHRAWKVGADNRVGVEDHEELAPARLRAESPLSFVSDPFGFFLIVRARRRPRPLSRVPPHDGEKGKSEPPALGQGVGPPFVEPPLPPTPPQLSQPRSMRNIDTCFIPCEANTSPRKIRPKPSTSIDDLNVFTPGVSGRSTELNSE